MHFFKSKHAGVQHSESAGFMKALSVNFLAKDLTLCVFFKSLSTSVVCNGQNIKMTQ